MTATATPLEPWRRNQYVTAAVVFAVFTAFAFVLPFLPLYVRELGVRDESAVALWAGVLIGVAPLLAGALAPVWGRLADRHGHKRLVVRALLCYVVLLSLSSLVWDVRQLLALRVGIGLFGGIGPLGLAMATALAPREETGRAVGLMQSAQILSAAIGPFAGGYLADRIGIRATFLVTASVCAGALVLLVGFYTEAPRAAVPPAAGRQGLRVLLRTPTVLALLAVLFFVNFVGRSFTPILPLYLQRLGVGRLALATGVLISAYSVAAAMSANVLGRATQRHAPAHLLMASLGGGALVVLPMAAAGSYLQLLALAVLLGLLSGGALTLCYTIGGLMVGPADRGAAFGVFAAAALVGGAVSPSVAGLLARWDLRAIYWLDGALFLVMAIAAAGGAFGTVAAQPARSESAVASST